MAALAPTPKTAVAGGGRRPGPTHFIRPEHGTASHSASESDSDYHSDLRVSRALPRLSPVDSDSRGNLDPCGITAAS